MYESDNQRNGILGKDNLQVMFKVMRQDEVT